LTTSGIIEASQGSCTKEEVAMRKLVLSTVVMALALLTGAHLEAAQDMGKAMAMLTGVAEVPGPGDPMGSGTVQVTLNPDTGEVCYELSVANIQEATAAHIHRGYPHMPLFFPPAFIPSRTAQNRVTARFTRV
jgi:CHRD domain